MDYKNYEPVHTALALLKNAKVVSDKVIAEITARLRVSPRKCFEQLEYESDGFIHVFDHDSELSASAYVVAVTLNEDGKPSLLVRDEDYEQEYTFDQLTMGVPYDVLYFMDMVNFPATADPNFEGEDEL